MKEEARKKRNETLLLELFPTFRVRVEMVIIILEAKGIRPRIQEAWRSQADQEEEFKSMHSQVRFGFHNITAPDGNREALAVDLVDEDTPLKTDTRYLLQLAAAAQDAGVMTGIRWGLPERLIGGIEAAIEAQNWDARVKVGWDPTHVQPVEITIEQARAGMRTD